MIRCITLSITVLTLAILSVFTFGCETNAQNDALLGGAIGAGAGAIIGHQSGHAAGGALIGGAVGGGTGYLIGNSKDKKEAKNQAGTATQQQAETVTVNITNSNGSITPVKMTKQGSNYVGPRGEIYDHLPAEAELKPVYGF